MPDLRVFLARRARVAKISVSTTRMFKGLPALLQQDLQHLQGRQGFGCAFSAVGSNPARNICTARTWMILQWHPLLVISRVNARHQVVLGLKTENLLKIPKGVYVKGWVGWMPAVLPRGTCPAYFCLLLSREQATVRHDHEED
jgi:hypothetical protein